MKTNNNSHNHARRKPYRVKKPPKPVVDRITAQEFRQIARETPGREIDFALEILQARGRCA